MSEEIPICKHCAAEMIAETPARFVCPDGHYRVVKKRRGGRFDGHFYQDVEDGEVVFAIMEDTEGDIYFYEYPDPLLNERITPRAEFDRRYKRDD